MAPFFFACAAGPQTELERLKIEQRQRLYLDCLHAVRRHEAKTRVKIVYPDPSIACANYVRRRLR